MTLRIGTVCVFAFTCGAAILSATGADSVGRRLQLLPTAVELSSPESRQTIIAQWQNGDQLEAQVATPVLQSSDESIARVEDGQVLPIANGKTTIRATADGQLATAEITVT